MTDDCVVVRFNSQIVFDEKDKKVFVVTSQGTEMFQLNETGRAIWELIDGIRTIREIVSELAGRFAIDRKVLRRNVLAFLRELKTNGFVHFFSQRQTQKNFEQQRDGIPCILPWTRLYIQADNSVRVCCFTPVFLGKVGDFSTLEEVWNGEAIREFRRAMRERKLGGICPLTCPYLNDRRYSSHRFWVPQNRPDHPRQVIRRILEEGSAAEVVPVGPLELHASLDDKCALRCVMCECNTGVRRVHPNFYHWLGKASSSLERLLLRGGEPFYSEQVIRLLKEANIHPPPYRFSFITSLSHLPLPLLKKIRIGIIVVSIDGATKSTYEAIRRGAHWETVMSNLAKLLRFRQRDHEWFRIQVNFTVMRQNVHEIPQAVRLFEGMGIPIRFNKVILGLGDSNDPFQSSELRKELLGSLKRGFLESEGEVTRLSIQWFIRLVEMKERVLF